jgi:hypothetical protein
MIHQVPIAFALHRRMLGADERTRDLRDARCWLAARSYG